MLMDVCRNLLTEGRKTALGLLRSVCHAEAVVAVGQPSSPFLREVQKCLKAEAAVKKRAELQAALAARKAERTKAQTEGEGAESEEEEAEEEVVEEEMEVDTSVRFFPQAVPDVLDATVSGNFTSFTLPEESEGLSVSYAWQPATEAQGYLRDFIVQKKQTELVANFTPSASVKEANDAWLSKKLQWRTKQKEWIKTLAEMERNDKERALAKKRAEEKAEHEKKEAEDNAVVDELLNESEGEGDEKKEGEELAAEPEP